MDSFEIPNLNFFFLSGVYLFHFYLLLYVLHHDYLSMVDNSFPPLHAG